LALAQDLGFDKQFAERWMCGIGGGWCEHDFGVTRDIKLRRVREPLRMRTRRSSTSSSGETAISVCVSIS